MDLFGKQVELTFKGKRTYQTDVGAFVSVLIKLTLLLFIFYEFYVIFARKHPAVSTKYILNDLSNDQSKSFPFRSTGESIKGFNLAVGFTTRDPQFSLAIQS